MKLDMIILRKCLGLCGTFDQRSLGSSNSKDGDGDGDGILSFKKQLMNFYVCLSDELRPTVKNSAYFSLSMDLKGRERVLQVKGCTRHGGSVARSKKRPNDVEGRRGKVSDVSRTLDS